jgi:hypothetical protein
MIGLGLIMLAIGGLPFLLWGVFFRTVIGLHTTWLVNSATHSWGTRRFVTKDMSTNSWWVAILTFGEGWHNNHHAHPVSARHGLKWYEIDMNWYGIWALTKLGLARQVYRVKLDELRQREEEEGVPAAARTEMVSHNLLQSCHPEGVAASHREAATKSKDPYSLHNCADKIGRTTAHASSINPYTVKGRDLDFVVFSRAKG